MKIHSLWHACKPLTILFALAAFHVSTRGAKALEGHGASVHIKGAVWSNKSCPSQGQSGPEPADYPKMRCGECSVTAVAIRGAEVNVNCEIGGGDDVFGSSSVNPGGTGVEIKVIDSSPGYTVYEISKPKKSGIIRVTATVEGECCPGPTPKKWEAIGTLEVILECDDGNDCGTCREGPALPFGGADVAASSVDFQLSLGLASPQSDAGILWLNTNTPSANLSKPDALKVPFTRPNVIVTNGPDGKIKQIRTPHGMVNVAVKDDY
jgi:hypothetical protein